MPEKLNSDSCAIFDINTWIDPNFNEKNNLIFEIFEISKFVDQIQRFCQSLHYFVVEIPDVAIITDITIQNPRYRDYPNPPSSKIRKIENLRFRDLIKTREFEGAMTHSHWAFDNCAEYNFWLYSPRFLIEIPDVAIITSQNPRYREDQNPSSPKIEKS